MRFITKLGCATVIALFWCTVWAYASPPQPETPHSVAEEDGDPTVWFPYQIKVTDGTLTDNGDGTVSINTGGGSGDSVTVNSTGADTTANFLDGTDITWTLTDGGAGGPDDITGTVVDDSHAHVYSNIDTTTSANWDDQVSDETGTGGAWVFASNPTLSGATLAGILADNDDMVFEADADNDGSNKFSFTDGLSAEVASIDETGLITTAVGIDALGDVDFDLGSADVDDFTFTTDGSGDSEIVLPNDSIGPAEIDSTTGAYDFGGVTSFEIPNSAAPTVDATGKIGVDTNVITQGQAVVYLTSALGYIVATTDTPGDNEVPTYDSAGGTIQWEAGGGGSSELWLLPESAVLDDNNPPAISIQESTGTGTPRRRYAAFDASTDEILYWSFTWQGYSNADVYWMANDTGANEDAIWFLGISATTEADADAMSEDAIDTYNTESEDVNTNEAYRLIKTTISLSNTDSAATDDFVTIVFGRDADDSIGDADADALTSDALLLGVYLY